MKYTVALLVISVLPFTVAAQQSEKGQPADVDYHCDKNPMFRDVCEKMEQQDKTDSLNRAAERADEAKTAVDNGNKIRSGDTNQKIDGLVGEAKDANSRVNNNPASKAVTDKSLSVIEELAHNQDAALDSIGKTATTISKPRPNSHSSWDSSQQHQLIESTKTSIEPPKLTIEQETLNRESQILSSAPPIAAIDDGIRRQGSDLKPSTTTLDQEILSREQNLLSSASTVASISKAVRAQEAAYAAFRAKEDAEARAKKLQDDRDRAEAEREAYIETERRAAEYDEDELREERREARERQAFIDAVYGPPVYQPPSTLSFIPTLPYGYDPSYIPATPYAPSYGYVPDTPSNGSQITGTTDFHATQNTKPAWSSVDYFSCMKHLATVVECAHNLAATDPAQHQLDNTAVSPATALNSHMFSADQSGPSQATGSSSNVSAVPETAPTQGTSSVAK